MDKKAQVIQCGKQSGKKSTQRKKKQKATARRVIPAVMLILLAFVLFFAAEVFGLDAWHDLDPQKILGADRSLFIYDMNGKEVSVLSGTEDRIWVSLKDVPVIVQNAFISAEDARFYEHNGLDIKRILGAIVEDIKSGGYVQGASTITQQLVKLSHLSSEKTFSRKIEEAIIAYQLESQFTKDEILEMYLNYVYFGGGFYGIEAAARGYFGIGANELTLEQGAALAAILKSPSSYAPHLNFDACKGRRDLVLRLMHDYGYINNDEYADALNTNMVLNYDSNRGEQRGYYIDTALKEACELLSIDLGTLLTGGYSVYTGLDCDIQSYCESIFDNDDMFPDVNVQGAIVVMDPNSGYVRGIVGGRNSDTAMAYNRATQIRRQPGSVIKPIISYAPALEYYGYTAASIIEDTEKDYDGYRPNNSDGKYRGTVTLRQAVKSSLNIPAVEVLSDIGVEAGKSFAKKMGIEFDERDTSLALALGGFTYGVSPLQIAGAYSVFASGGMYNAPAFISKITDSSGNVVYERLVTKTRIMSSENAFILTSMLESAIKDGTGRRLGELGIPLAGKTGTVGNSDGNRDAWMAAYNMEYSAVVWLGYDTAADGDSLPADSGGGRYPALILRELYGRLYSEDSAPGFIKPENVIEVRLDDYSIEHEGVAVLANAFTPQESILTEFFVKGTEPTISGDYWSIPEPPSDIHYVTDESGAPVILFSPLKDYIIYKLYREYGAGGAELLGEFTGSLELVAYTDKEAPYNCVLEYYVIPVHPTLVIGDMKVTGTSSQRLFVPRPDKLPLTAS